MAAMANEKRETTGGVVPHLTPYELAFGHAYFEEDRFPGIREEAEGRGVVTWRPDQFMLLGEVGHLLQELMPEDDESAEWREAFERYGQLLFHAYHFWRFGRQLYVVEESLARWLAGDDIEVGVWEMTPPAPAGYVRLPKNLFWARVEEGETPEPVDGFFWTMVGTEDPAHAPYERLDQLLILGMRVGRPGFGMIPVGTELVAAPVGHWGDADARPDGPDFGNILPGGELQGYHALVTEAEALKLLSRVFWYVATRPASVGEPEEVEGDGVEALPPTSLSFRRVGEVERHG